MKPLRNAGIAIIVGMIIGLITLIYSMTTIFSKYEFNDLINRELMSKIMAEAFPLPLFVFTILLSIVVIIFTYSGFISLGKRFNQTLLKVSAWVLLGALILHSVLSGIISYQVYYLSSQSQFFLTAQGILSLIFLVLYVVFYILLGVSLLKLKKNVEMAKTVGVLYIVSAATTIILVGSVLLWITQIFVAVMFFKASKKFE